MATKHRKLISFDWAIKKILRSKANFEILEGFLSEEEAETMLERTLNQYGKTFFVEGKEEGIQKGIQKGKIETLILLLEERFGSLSLKQKEMICQFNEGDFTQAFKKLFSIKRLDDIFTVDD